jgi:hypothetical protein
LKQLAILISPQAKSAYFKDFIDVARAEFSLLFGETELSHVTFGGLEFFNVTLPEQAISQLVKLSFVQGLFERTDAGLLPLAEQAQFNLHEDFVFGSKYKGKTNEHLTQLLLNVGLQHIQVPEGQTAKLLDPMCGRGTTVMWALRYGLNAKGIEQDTKALDDIRMHLKKWTKLHRQKHKLIEGSVGTAKKKKDGQFLELQVDALSARFVQCDTRESTELIKNEKFDLLISDLPYGVQHFTTNQTRNPLAVLEESIEGWKALMKKQGAMVFAYNQYLPKRAAFIKSFEASGLVAQPFRAPHRMSESIVRDILVFKHA